RDAGRRRARARELRVEEVEAGQRLEVVEVASVEGGDLHPVRRPVDGVEGDEAQVRRVGGERRGGGFGGTGAVAQVTQDARQQNPVARLPRLVGRALEGFAE